MSADSLERPFKRVYIPVEEAKANRKRFLAPYKAEFEKTRNPEIIIHLLKLSPSHLKEDWILNEIIRWLNSHDHLDHLERAFLHKSKNRRTRKQRIDEMCDLRLAMEVNRIIHKGKERGQKISKTEAFRELALRIEGDDSPEQLEVSIKKMYYRHYRREKNKEKRELPYPYYDHDIIVENGRVVLDTDPTIQLTLRIFGDWVINP